MSAPLTFCIIWLEHRTTDTANPAASGERGQYKRLYDGPRTVQGRLYAYREDRIAVDDFWARAYGQMRKSKRVTRRDAFHSDPMARGGMMLANPSRKMATRMEWVAAIEDAWAEYVMEDSDDRESLLGLPYVLEHYYCLTEEPRKPEQNAEARAMLCRECRISERTLFAWMGKITDIVVYHAARRKLI